jgi:hypothetical protein
VSNRQGGAPEAKFVGWCEDVTAAVAECSRCHWKLRGHANAADRSTASLYDVKRIKSRASLFRVNSNDCERGF